MRTSLLALALLVTFSSFVDSQTSTADAPTEEIVANDALPKALLVGHFFRAIRPESAGNPGGIFDTLVIDPFSREAALILEAAHEAKVIQNASPHGSVVRDYQRWQALRLGAIYQTLLDNLVALGFEESRIEDYVDTVVRKRVTLVVSGGKSTFADLEEAFREGERAAIEDLSLPQSPSPGGDSSASRLALRGSQDEGMLDLVFSYQPGTLGPPPKGFLLWAEPSHTLLVAFNSQDAQFTTDGQSPLALAAARGEWGTPQHLSLAWTREGDDRIVVELVTEDAEQNVIADVIVNLAAFDIVTSTSATADDGVFAWFHECRCPEISRGARCTSPSFSCNPSTCAVKCR